MKKLTINKIPASETAAEHHGTGTINAAIQRLQEQKCETTSQLFRIFNAMLKEEQGADIVKKATSEPEEAEGIPQLQS